MAVLFVLKDLKRNKYVFSQDKLVKCVEERWVRENILFPVPQLNLTSKLNKADLFSYVEARRAKVLVHDTARARKWAGVFHFKIVRVGFK